MIVVLSFNDPGIIKAAKALGKKHNQKVVFFDENCFAELKANEPVVFIGHADGDKYDWGSQKLSPEDFLLNLEKFNFPFKMVKELMLEGCKINFGNNNFLRNFAKILYKNPDRQRIKLRGFSNLIGHKLLKDMHVAVPYSPNGSVVITEITPEQKQIISNELKTTNDEHDAIFMDISSQCEEIIKIYTDIRKFFAEFNKSETPKEDYQSKLDAFHFELTKIKDSILFNKYQKYFHQILDNIDRCINTLKLLKDIYPPLALSNVRIIQEFATEIEKQPDHVLRLLENEHKDLTDKLIKKHGTTYDLKTDIITALTANRSYLVTYDLLPKLNQFDENRFRLWGIINARIAHLLENKPTFDFLGKLSKILTPLNLILIEIEDPSKNLSGIINKILANPKLLTTEEMLVIKEIKQQNFDKKHDLPPPLDHQTKLPNHDEKPGIQRR